MEDQHWIENRHSYSFVVKKSFADLVMTRVKNEEIYTKKSYGSWYFLFFCFHWKNTKNKYVLDANQKQSFLKSTYKNFHKLHVDEILKGPFTDLPACVTTFTDALEDKKKNATKKEMDQKARVQPHTKKA